MQELKNEKVNNQEMAQTNNEPAAKEKAAKDYELEINRLLQENKRLKDATNNACSDASEWKKKFRATQTEAERQAAEQAELIARIQAENESYKAAERIANYKSKLMESGYDSETAASMASSLPDGISDDFFAQQKTFYENTKTRMTAEMLNKQPDLTPGTSPTSKTIEEQEMNKLRRWAGLPEK